MSLKLLMILSPILLVSNLSCLIEADALGQQLKFNAKIDSADAEITPEDADLSCEENSDCVIIDRGCCRGEKRLALNKNRALALIKKRSSACSDLRAEKFKELLEHRKAKSKDKKHQLCYGRQTARNYNEEAVCVDKKCAIRE